ncbi:hypothetical protein CKO12_00350 [Chromatium okenii]|uniref:hypothetical protein n=1 Tax=Chromatium okenii TaxID=61644 RepID=UPI0019057044|nr:hypothetical protein [Chromatium okenii]MBK1640357.1 hypothetical protein [Chromatium okenii]
MSTKQAQAIWELCRQGFQFIAEDAAHCWRSGQRFQLADCESKRFNRLLTTLIEQCNWEIERVSNSPFSHHRM